MKNKICKIIVLVTVLLLAACSSQFVYDEANGYAVCEIIEVMLETEADNTNALSENIDEYGAISYSDADIYEWVDVDFIVVTNGDEFLEPIKLWEGDMFLGLTLKSLSHTAILTRNSQFYVSQGIAEFMGEIVVRGDLVLWGMEWRSGIYLHEFTVHEHYRSRFPMLVNNNSGYIRINIENEDDLLEMLGVSHYSEENNSGAKFEDIIIHINNFTIVGVDGAVMDTAVIVDTVDWWWGELPIEFNTLPNGTRVDARVDDEVVDLIFRHFDAIENGDVVAFRETLQGQDGISANNQANQILAHFWDIVVGDYEDEMFWGDSDIDLTSFGWNRLFNEEFPAVDRNTGLHVAEIRNSYGHWGHGVVVTVIDNNQEEAVYILHLLGDFGWIGVDLRFRLY
ncbi:MAG: hypothetical protein FWC77_02810 [Defluviitaleaceae bacterium]|nr:hypothetical protein [Defluviitaleaceae bacterium]